MSNKSLSDAERTMLEDLAKWIATAPRDMILVLYGMMIMNSGKVE